MRKSLCLLLSLAFAAGAAPRQIGYFASWQIYDRSKLAVPANFDFSLWTAGRWRGNGTMFYEESPVLSEGSG